MKNNFDSHASSYDGHSQIQKEMAGTLFGCIRRVKANYSSVFEIGCGTGHLSGLLATLKPDKLYLNDISHNMLAVVKQKIHGYENEAEFIENDFEEYKFEKSFDLIASNAVMQWFKDLSTNFKKIFNALDKNGIFAFSIFTEGTFSELSESFREAYKQTGLPYQNHVLDFYSSDFILDKLEKSGLKVESFETAEYQSFYNNALDFLKELRSIGASHFKNENVKYPVMKKMLQIYENTYKNSQKKIPVSYRALHCFCKKKDQTAHLA